MPLSLTSEQVWHEVEKQFFAVLGTVTASHEPRTVGIVYVVRERCVYIGTERSSWKVRHILARSNVSLTVTPASEANSTENTDEIRVDGRDTYVESGASSIGTTSGFVSFNWRPRHSAADAVKCDLSCSGVQHA